MSTINRLKLRKSRARSAFLIILIIISIFSQTIGYSRGAEFEIAADWINKALKDYKTADKNIAIQGILYLITESGMLGENINAKGKEEAISQ